MPTLLAHSRACLDVRQSHFLAVVELQRCFVGRRVVVVSPHADDVALSMGGVVHSINQVAAAVTLLTVFGRSSWALTARGDADAVTSIRRDEDLTYSALYGMRSYTLELPDASLRGYSSETELLEVNDSAMFIGHADSTICQALSILDADVVFCPGGIGNHVDHVICMRSVERWVRRSRCECLYYQDLPYAASIGNRYMAPRSAFQVYRMDILISDALELKLSSLSAYPSQIDHELVDQIRAHAIALAHRSSALERYWVVASRDDGVAA